MTTLSILCSLPLCLLSPSVLQFIDLCILLGCDYCGTIKGIGPKRAFDLIKQHGCIEEILENIDLKVGKAYAFLIHTREEVKGRIEWGGGGGATVN